MLPALAHLHTLRVFAGFHFGSAPDEKDSRRTIADLYQGGLGLPDRDYYLKDDTKTKAIRAAYVEHLQKMFQLLGDKPKAAAKQAKTVLDFETRLARASRTRVARDPHRNYHLLKAADINAETPGVSWQTYFQALGLKGLKEANVGQPDFLKEVGRLLKEAPLDDWKTYLRGTCSTLTPTSSVRPSSRRTSTSRGPSSTARRNRPRWERVVATTDRLLGEALGQLYVAKEFPPEAKARRLALVKNIKQTLRQRLATLDWMSPQTRQQALKKLDAISVKIGHPDNGATTAV